MRISWSVSALRRRGLCRSRSPRMLRSLVPDIAARTVTWTGALCGGVLGTAIAVTAGWAGWALLLATFAVAVVTLPTRFAAQDVARNCRRAWRPAGRRQRHREYRSRRGRSGVVGAELRAGCRAHRIRCRPGCGRQRHCRQRDRQSLGTTNVSLPDVPAACRLEPPAPYRSKAPLRAWPARSRWRALACGVGLVPSRTLPADRSRRDDWFVRRERAGRDARRRRASSTTTCSTS